MKRFTLFVATLLLFHSLHAQNKPGSISGKILSSDNKPVESATVQLLKEPGKGLAKAALTNKKGEYSFENIAEGKYVLAISMTVLKKDQLKFSS